MKHWNHIIRILFLVVLLAPSLTLAAPSVSNVSGTLTHGGTITVSGSGFGTKATAAPTVWDDASSGTHLTDSGKWDGYWPNTGSDLSYITQYHTPMRGIALPHSHITRYIAGAHGISEGYNAGYNVMFWKTMNVSSYPRYAYASWYQRYDPAQSPLRSDWNLKYFDYSYGNSPYTMDVCLRNNWYLSYAPTNVPLTTATPGVQHALNDDSWGVNGCAGSLDPNTNEFGGCNNCWWGGGANPLNQWHKFEVELIITNQSSGHIKVWEDGALKTDYAGRTDAWTLGNRAIAIGGYSREIGANAWQYYADAYMDFSLSRVLLGDAATYAASTIREIQIPSAWSDTALTLTANLGQFTSGTAYLYVVDSTGAVNANGYPVTVGGAPDTAPPSAPTGLGVQ